MSEIVHNAGWCEAANNILRFAKSKKVLYQINDCPLLTKQSDNKSHTYSAAVLVSNLDAQT
jgi:hypothetical protein